jgi:general secretion pathway protein D
MKPADLQRNAMGRAMRAHRLLPWLVAGCCGGPALAQTPAPVLPAPAVVPAPAPSTLPAIKPGEPINLNFPNTDIEAAARLMSVITGRNVVVDPRVKGTISLTPDKAVTPAQAYELFLATLRLQGFTVVTVSGLDKVVPEADAKLQGGSVAVEGAGKAAGGQIQTQVFKLNYENANNLLTVLRPLISPNNTINVNPGNNSLIITDYADNLRRLGQIIAALDVSSATDVEILPIKHAIASDVAALVTRLLDSTGGVAAPGQIDSSFKTTVIAEPRSNALIVRAANGARLGLVRSLVDKLDQPLPMGPNGAAGNIYVVPLKNADATKLAATLRAAMSGEARSATAAVTAIQTAPAIAGATATAQSAAQSQATTGGQIQADVATNSLVITAPEPQYRQLRAVIDKLDGRRAQVLVESLIVEVNDDKAAQFGIQWQGVSGQSGDTNIGILGTNFSTGNTANIISLALSAAKTGTTLPSSGGNFAIAHNTNGTYVLGLVANYLQSSGAGNVLSMPNLLTLDNEEAKIIVGENVPFVTGQFTNTGSGTTGSVNPFQTIERKDVGLTLKVKPQINENGTVKLVVFQETSAVKAGTEAAATGPTTNKRSVESTVLVDDGTVVVLGGLMQDTFSGNQDKVPLLGDIPLLGYLFRSEARARNKSNLMLFLRPVVVRDARDNELLGRERYEQIRGLQQGAQPTSNAMIPVNEAPQLPALPAARASAPQTITKP